MFTYTGLRNLFGDLTNNSSSANLTLGDTLINNFTRQIVGGHDFDFLEKSVTMSTVASQQFYNLPFDYEKLINVTVTISSTVYTPKPCYSRVKWDELNTTTSITSDIPQEYFIFNGQLGFYPKPASATTNAITFIFKRAVRDLSIADYTTGGIITAVNASTALVGTGTTWTVSMAGRYLRITESDTASKGDGFWYEISSSGTATTITLVKGYNGTAITSGNAAYTIGQVSILPETYQILPVYMAAELFFTSIQPDQTRAALYKNLGKELYRQLIADHLNKTTGVTIGDGIYGRELYNPNLYPSL